MRDLWERLQTINKCYLGIKMYICGKCGVCMCVVVSVHMIALQVLFVYVVIRVIFFSAVNAHNKKTVTSCIFFFCCKWCKPAYTTYRQKKNYTT